MAIDPINPLMAAIHREAERHEFAAVCAPRFNSNPQVLHVQITRRSDGLPVLVRQIPMMDIDDDVDAVIRVMREKIRRRKQQLDALEKGSEA